MVVKVVKILNCEHGEVRKSWIRVYIKGRFFIDIYTSEAKTCLDDIFICIWEFDTNITLK